MEHPTVAHQLPIMAFPLLASFVTTLFGLALAGIAIFLILLVLVQRGRGGGLAGALGGMGGSSAFGAKAGDVFTKITVVVASIWIVLCIAAAKFSTPTSSRLNVGATTTTSSAMSSLDTDGEDTSGDSTATEAEAAETEKIEETSPAEETKP